MSKYIKQERAKYWPVSAELMVQYQDGSHTKEDWDYCLLWKKNNKLHRDGDKPAWIGRDGTLSWWQNGKRHRDEDKPAYIGRDGTLTWYQNGLCHRYCGPSRIYSDGEAQWWWRGVEMPVTSQEEFVQYLTKHNLIKDEDMNPKNAKIITAREALAIYEEAVKKKNLMLAKLWEETYASKLDKLVREQAERGYISVSLEYLTWRPMKNFIEDLGYRVTCYPEDPYSLVVSWNKE